MPHHPRCYLEMIRLTAAECPMCDALTAAERDGYARGWQAGANGRPAAP